MNAKTPITDNTRLERILNHFSRTSFADYFFSVCALHTGAYLGDLLGIRVKDMAGADGFTNARNGFRFHFDESMLSALGEYMKTLPGGAVYLFPSKRDCTVQASTEQVSRHFSANARKIGECVCHMQFVKTFAFRYFIGHGNLKATGLCPPGTDTEKILRYLCMTGEEYAGYKKLLPPDRKDVSGILSEIAGTRSEVDAILDGYAEYIRSGGHSPSYESGTESFFRKLGLLISDYRK